MTKKETELYYPYRDHILALNIIKILVLNPKISGNRIGVLLEDIGKSATPPAIKVALERLVETDYVIKKSTRHKSQTHSTWELSCVGNIASLIILKDGELHSFVNSRKEDKFYKMIHVLIENSKQDLMELLIYRLNGFTNDRLKIEKIALGWYDEARSMISKMDASKHPELKLLQEKIIKEGFAPINLTKKGFIIDPMWTETRLDRIC